MNAQTTKSINHAREIVGRKYPQVRYGVHSRKIENSDGWGGTSHYRTLEEAQAALNGCGQRFQKLGELVIDFGEATDLREYRIVKIVSECEVVHTEVKKV